MAIIKITAPAGSPFKTLAKKSTVTISASDMTTMSTSLTVTDSVIEDTITEIPAGENRLFRVSVYDSLDTLQFNGSTTADIIPNSTVRVAIALVRISGNALINGTAVNQALSGMKLVPGGVFSMGSADTADKGVQPVHTVTVDSFYMDSVEMTQQAYFDLMGFNPTTYMPYAFYPVDSITWYDAVLCANARSKRDLFDTVYSYSAAVMKIILSNNGATEAVRCTSLTNLSCDLRKKGYRLPTEAEWEYACRAGTTTANYWGDDMEESTVAKYAWFDNNSSWHLNLVAWKLPNAWGLYDMIGNAWEWCNDWYADGYASAPAVNPAGPATGTERVMRGGGQNSIISDRYLRSASRQKAMPKNYRFNRGFRLVIPK